MSDTVSPFKQPVTAVGNAALTREVGALIVAALNLDVAAADIDPRQAPVRGGSGP